MSPSEKNPFRRFQLGNSDSYLNGSSVQTSDRPDLVTSLFELTFCGYKYDNFAQKSVTVTLCYENFPLAVKSTRHVEHDRSSIGGTFNNVNV